MRAQVRRAAVFFAIAAASAANFCGLAATANGQSPSFAAERPLASLPAVDAEMDANGATVPSVDRIAELEQRIAQLEASSAEFAGPPPAPEPKPDPLAMKAGWGKNGFEAATADGKFKIHVGGRVQLDGVALQQSDLVLGGVGTDDAVDFRRARLRVDGTMYKTMQWCAEFDFVNGFDYDPANGASPVTANGGDVGNVVAPTDLWWLFTEVPVVGNVRIGNQKEPIGLEHMNSSRFLDFMERSFLQDAYFGPFNNGFSPGVSLSNWNEAETVLGTIGAYKNTQDVFAYDTGDNEYSVTGRLSCVPWAANDDAQLVHLGCGASFRKLDQDVAPATGNLRIRSRASLRNGPGPLNPNLADTNFVGRLLANNETLLAPEIAIVDGPWLWQAEYVAGFLNSVTFTPNGGAATNAGQVFTQGQYVQVLYFLTGEHRVYERHEGRFGRVVPNCNATWNPCGFGSLGAWQIGARYGFLDLNDPAAGVNAGYIQDLTLGLNWFLNPFAKFQFNYIHQRVENTQVNSAGVVTAVNNGDLDGFGVRFAQDF